MLRDAAHGRTSFGRAVVMAAMLAEGTAMVADDDKDGVRLGATGRREHGVQSRDECIDVPDALDVCVRPTQTNALGTARHACVCGIHVGRARGAAYADIVARGVALRLGSKPWCAARAHTCG